MIKIVNRRYVKYSFIAKIGSTNIVGNMLVMAIIFYYIFILSHSVILNCNLYGFTSSKHFANDYKIIKL